MDKKELAQKLFDNCIKEFDSLAQQFCTTDGAGARHFIHGLLSGFYRATDKALMSLSIEHVEKLAKEFNAYEKSMLVFDLQDIEDLDRPV